MTNISARKARENLSEVMNRVAYGKERIILTRHGAEVVAIVPIEDAKLLEELEDQLDLEDARKSLVEAKKEGSVSWDKVKAELGL